MKNLVQRKTWIAMLVICVAALQAYAPAIRAGWIWDDDSYILENAAVQLPGGVLDAWVPGSTPQYYPLVFVSFWVQHAVHGLDPFGYHLANVLLHVGSTLMLWRLLRRMRVPGSLLAAGLFALHPVQVEPVAWGVGLGCGVCVDGERMDVGHSTVMEGRMDGCMGGWVAGGADQ